MPDPTYQCDTELLERMVQQSLNESQLESIGLHLNECESCRRTLQELVGPKQFWDLANSRLLGLEIPDSAESSEADRDSDVPMTFLKSILGPTDDPDSMGRLGSYEISGIIGVGGMGIVLKGFDASLNRYVAIKLLSPQLCDRSTARQRFHREAKAAAAVIHENVLAIHAVDSWRGVPYLVMPCIRGRSLARRIEDEGALPLVEVLRIAQQIALGLAEAHAQGVVHRDVKPANILLSDGAERLKISDFGLARAADDVELTRSGTISGTPMYMSPEQARGELVGPRSDIFSFGSLLYELCTGHPPFRAETPYGAMRRVQEDKQRPIHCFNPQTPVWLCNLIDRMLAKSPDDRNLDAAELAEFFRFGMQHLQKPAGTQLPESLKSFQPSQGGHAKTWTLGLVALVLLSLVSALVWKFNVGNPTVEKDTPTRVLPGDAENKGALADNRESNNPSGESYTGPKTFNVDFSRAPETTISISSWKPEIEEQPKLSFPLVPVQLKGQADFWEKHVKTAVNSVVGKAVLSHHHGRPGSDSKPLTRFELVDLKSGETLRSATQEGLWVALAIHDDGERIVVQDVSERDKSGELLGTVKIDGEQIVPLDFWKPYETLDKPTKEKVVRFAQFINVGNLVTLSQSGEVVVWDFETRNPVRRFSYHGACQPSLSNDRKYLAICGGDIFGVVNLEEATSTPSVIPAPQMNYWLSSSFSPSCKRFAAATMNKLMIWDVPSGEVLFEGRIPGIPTAGPLFFPHEDFVMINNDKVVEFASGVKLWCYRGGSPVCVGGEMAYVDIGPEGGKLLPVDIPHSTALEMLNEAKSQSDLFVLKEGSSVCLNLSQIPIPLREKVKEKLIGTLNRNGFEHSEGSDLELIAEITGPKTEAVNYQFAGSFVFEKYESILDLEYQGSSLWNRRASNVPAAVSGRDKERVEEQLRIAGREPNLEFFGSVQMPDYLQKPNPGKGSNHHPQMLGVSEMGPEGWID